MSSAEICGTSMISWEIWMMVRQMSSMSAAGCWGVPKSRLKMRVRLMSSRARLMFSGGRVTARSRIISRATPPWPKAMTGPNTGSRCAETNSSCAPMRRPIFCTTKPST